MLIVNQNKLNILKRLGKRVAVSYALIFLGWLVFVVAGGAVAFFSDLEKSADNVLAAGVLKMEIIGDGIDFENFKYGNLASTTLAVLDSGNTPFRHGFDIESTGDLCQYLNLTAKYSGVENWEMKDVSLAGFSSGYDFLSGSWTINVNLPKKNKTKTGSCSFELAFRAVQDGDTVGYWDRAEIANWISTGAKADYQIKAQSFMLVPVAEEIISDTASPSPEITPPQPSPSLERENVGEIPPLEPSPSLERENVEDLSDIVPAGTPAEESTDVIPETNDVVPEEKENTTDKTIIETAPLVIPDTQ